MVVSREYSPPIDPAALLDEGLEHTWDAVCHFYDVTNGLPELGELFDHADLAVPIDAAKSILTNMLLEVMGSISRFSPWYTKPARSFGLTSIRDPRTNCSCWTLAPEAVQQWKNELNILATTIEKSSGFIQAMVLVDRLTSTPVDDPFVVVQCACKPQRMFQIRQSMLENAEIICDACKQPFF